MIRQPGMTPKAAMILEMAESLDSFDAKEIFALGRDPWGFNTLREIDEQFWERQADKAIAARKKERPWWLDFPPRDRPRKRPGWLLVGFGMGLGGLALLVWRFFRDRKIRKQQDAAAGRKPVRQEVWVPRGPGAQCQLLNTARAWVAQTPTADDFELARAVWRSHWPGVPYPRPPHERDHPSLGEALEYVDAVIEVAREQAAGEGVNEDEGVNAGEAAMDGDDAPVSDEELAQIDAALAAELAGDAAANDGLSEASVAGDQLPGSDEPANDELGEASVGGDQLPGSEAPAGIINGAASTPTLVGQEGSELSASDELALGGGVDMNLSGVGFDLSAAEPSAEVEPADPASHTRPTPTPGYLYRARAGEALEDIAAAALRRAGLEAATARGWAPAKARTRAAKLADNHRRRTTYVALIERSSWNTAREDGPLWLPPLRLGALFDRTRRRKVTVEPGSWPDGSSKLEPPPGLRGSAA